MNWFLTAIICTLVVELVLYFPCIDLTLRIHKTSVKAARVIRAKAVSDHWKEMALAAYAKTTFLSSIKLAGIFATIFAITAIGVVVFNYYFDDFQSFFLGWRGIGFSAIFTTIYLIGRKLIVHETL